MLTLIILLFLSSIMPGDLCTVLHFTPIFSLDVCLNFVLLTDDINFVSGFFLY